jgi:hypothetical protein
MRLAVAVVAALVVAAGAQAARNDSTLKITAKLNASTEAPRPNVDVRNAGGAFAATLTPTKKGYTMDWRISFSKLSGPASSAYVHMGAKGKFGPALFYLCSPCKPGAHGTAYASPSEVDMMVGGKTYVNIRTKKNPSGEIRGQLAKVG